MGWKKFNSRRKVRKKSIFRRKWFLMLFGAGVLCLVVGLIVAYFIAKPYMERADTYELGLINEIEQPSILYDRESVEVGRMFTENRDSMPIAEVSQLFIDVLLVGEDSRFFSHDGYDIKGITRAAIQTLKTRENHSGASTITQQLARNAFHLQDEARERGESNYERKLVEIFLARRIEEKYTKLEILEFYLNRVNFGGGFYGLRSAALGYFGKEPKDLSVSECASLVGAIRNPSAFSPKNEKANIQVRNRVFVRMEAEGMISAKELEEYKKLPLVLNPKPIQRGTSHLHARVEEEFSRIAQGNPDQFPESELTKGGYQIFTSVDSEVQQKLEKKLRQQLLEAEATEGYQHALYKDFRIAPKANGKAKKPQYLQGAAMMINHHTGEVLGYVGGRDFVHSQYDFIASGKRPLGTAFFPFIYTAALDSGLNASTRLIDEAMDNRQMMVDGVEGILGEWGNEVMKPKYEGVISMRRALAASKIAATARLGRKVGLRKIWNTAEKFSMTAPDGKLLNRTLLGSESVSLSNMVRSYGAFANGGKVVEDFVWITKIVNARGDVVYEWDRTSESKQVIEPSTAFLVHTMLHDALQSGSGSDVFAKAKMGSFIGGGKTGTTSDFSDNWFLGYDGNVTCGVWAGFLEGPRKEIYPAAFSKNTVMPVWIDAMKIAQRKLSQGEIEKPSNIIQMRICRHSGQQETKACEEFVRDVVTGEGYYRSTGYTEYFEISKRPKGLCPVHGFGMGEIDSDDSPSGLSASERLNTIPIKPTKPTLLGFDPYNSEAPVYAPHDRSVHRAGRGLGAIDLKKLQLESEKLEIEQPAPDRIIITE